MIFIITFRTRRKRTPRITAIFGTTSILVEAALTSKSSSTHTSSIRGNRVREYEFLLRISDIPITVTCQITSTANKVEYVIGEPSVTTKVMIPPYYDAMTTPTGGHDWNTVKHYCNFQDTTVRLLKVQYSFFLNRHYAFIT